MKIFWLVFIPNQFCCSFSFHSVNIKVFCDLVLGCQFLWSKLTKTYSCQNGKGIYHSVLFPYICEHIWNFYYCPNSCWGPLLMSIYPSSCPTTSPCSMVSRRICSPASSFRRPTTRCSWMPWSEWPRRRISSLWTSSRRNWSRPTKWWLSDTGKDGNFWRVTKRLPNSSIYNYLHLNFWISLISIVKKILGFWKWLGSLHHWFFNVFKSSIHQIFNKKNFKYSEYLGLTVFNFSLVWLKKFRKYI